MPPLLLFLDECSTWAVTTYPRCDFRCVYCHTHAQGSSFPLYPARSIVRDLRRELTAVPSNDNITLGSLSDAYPPAEERYGVTRLVVAELIAQGRRFSIVTKGRTVCRDVDLLTAPAARCAVQISLCTVDESVLPRLEPGAPSAAERLEVVHTLAAAGLSVSISAAPWIPGVSDARALLERVPAGVLVQFAPLNVEKPLVPRRFLGRDFVQAEVDALYLREREAVGDHAQAVWLYPVTACRARGLARRHAFATMVDGMTGQPGVMRATEPRELR